ncbi:MAG: 1-deoxy-D-xylulose-5-phosphate reductoisomerase [Clostridiales bacterium]|nr:1-deoxy-D-xylulose-5-phosphate reductoisomerase [Clostridiales bacterium]
MKTVGVLGSTGSIGLQTLEVCRWFPGELRVGALAAGSNVRLLAAQAREFKPQLVALADQSAYRELQAELSGLPVQIAMGEEGLNAVAAYAGSSMTVAAIAGIAGLKPTFAALEAGKQVALANKEVLVAAGALAMAAARRHNVTIFPVDSEHSAIYQCLAGEESFPAKLILTASGGSFRLKCMAELENVTAAEALCHPTWNMGRKVTVDSASLANKGLEVIEAHWLFGVGYDNIEVLIHPQSMVHSLVRFTDGSIKAQLGPADMRLPIQYAMLGSARLGNPAPVLDLADIGTLSFAKPDYARFPALKLAYTAGRSGSSYTTAYNAANEVLGAAFLAGRISFTAIGAGLEAALAAHTPCVLNNITDVLSVDAETKVFAEKYVEYNVL